MSTQGGSAFHVTATGVIDSGPGGILHAVVIGTPGTSTPSLTLRDGGSSGPVIAVITPSAPVSLVFDSVIRASIAYAESAERAISILDHRPDLGSDYLSLAEEALSRMPGLEQARSRISQLR